MKNLIPLVIGLVVVALLAVGLLSQTDDAKSVLEGRPAPDFKGATLEGSSFDSRQVRGKSMIINFWASWCKPCREEAPLLTELERKLGNRATLVGVLLRDRPQDARKFALEFGHRFPSLLNTDNAIAFDYGVVAPPETFFINAQGVVLKRYIGALTSEALRRNLERLGIVL